MNIRVSLHILLTAISLCMALSVSGQRNVTPVESDDKKPKQPTLHYYDKHGKPLDEPVLFLADLDTVKKPTAAPVYPKIYSTSIGLNIWDMAMALAGQSYKGLDIWADLSLHNWIFPTAELGIGWANHRPKEGDYNYKGKPSFYAKVGVNYNFLYKSNPDYQFFLGVRLGVSHFGYEITDISIRSDYWQQDNRFSITDQSATALYGEALAGVKVKIWKNFSMGWTFRYHGMFKCTDGSMSTPAYIPGFGSKTGKISASFSLIYTIPLARGFKLPETAE